MITYTEFPSGKVKRTRGVFVRWERGGLVGFVYAVVQRKASVLFIPRHDIAAESLAELPPVGPL